MDKFTKAVKKEAFTSDISDIGMPDVILSTALTMYTTHSYYISYMWSPNMTSAKKLTFFFFSLLILLLHLAIRASDSFLLRLSSLVFITSPIHLSMCHYYAIYFCLQFSAFVCKIFNGSSRIRVLKSHYINFCFTANGIVLNVCARLCSIIFLFLYT